MALVAAQDVLDDGEPEAGAAELARARAVDPVEALGEAGNVLPGDPGALVLHGDPHAGRPATGPAAAGAAATASAVIRTICPSPPYLMALSIRLTKS